MRAEIRDRSSRYPAAPKWNPDVRYVFDLVNERRMTELWWQRQGLTQTASGYGEKLATAYMVRHKGIWKRVYCVCHSNIGTLFIMDGGKQVVVDFE